MLNYDREYFLQIEQHPEWTGRASRIRVIRRVIGLRESVTTTQEFASVKDALAWLHTQEPDAFKPGLERTANENATVNA